MQALEAHVAGTLRIPPKRKAELYSFDEDVKGAARTFGLFGTTRTLERLNKEIKRRAEKSWHSPLREGYHPPD